MVRSMAVGVFQAIVIGITTTFLMELLVGSALAYPSVSPLPGAVIGHLYNGFDAKVIQFDPQCAVYDREVTYTMRPGRCRFANREYDNEYRINRLGVRDTEAASRRPEIVFLGDSVTMGLGVEQEEAFPQVVARATGRRTLNAGISSYGTARELLLLKRLDRSNLRQVVIQYWDNDYAENSEFAGTGELDTLSQDEYEEVVATQEAERGYWPGKYTYHSLRLAQRYVSWRLGDDPDADVPDGEQQAEAFVGALERSPVDLTAIPVTVVAANPEFLADLKERARQSSVAWVRQIDVVDIASSFSFDGARFVMDDHPTREGHADIARKISTALRDSIRHHRHPAEVG